MLRRLSVSNSKVLSELDERLDDRDDGMSEEVSVSESLVNEKKGGSLRRPKYSNKSYEESTDAESASESELGMLPLKE
jgi:hypothetical protein